MPTRADFVNLIDELCGRSGLDPANVVSILITPDKITATKQVESQLNANGVFVTRTTTFTQNVTS